MTRAVVRSWNTKQGWGIADSPLTPGGCVIPAGAIVDVEGTHELVVGETVEIEWTDISDRPQRSLTFIAHLAWPVDPQWDLGTGDAELLDAEDPVIGDDDRGAFDEVVGAADQAPRPRSSVQHVDHGDPLGRARSIAGGDLLVRAAPDLVVAIAAADPHAQRTFARWRARRAFEYSTLAGKEWVDPALEDLRAGRVPGAPFDYIQSVFSRWQEDVDSGVYAALSAGQVGSTRPLAGPFDHADSSVPIRPFRRSSRVAMLIRSRRRFAVCRVRRTRSAHRWTNSSVRHSAQLARPLR